MLYEVITSCYAMPMNILKKSPEELKKIYDAGLTMFYLGIESGSDIVLKKVTKGATQKTRITSYNVCYTKLLRSEILVWCHRL